MMNCKSPAPEESASSFFELQERLEKERHALFCHPVYGAMESALDLRVFMEHHVFAVWDFMSLVKGLQLALTSVEVPWRPTGDPRVRRFVNEIVLGEESDDDGAGGFLSHLELYLQAMADVGADRGPILCLMEALEKGVGVPEALASCGAPPAAQAFSGTTFAVLEEEGLHGVAAAFTLGREGLIPPMFVELLKHLEEQGDSSTEALRFYLARHIELDGESHGPMAELMLESLCGNDGQKWADAERVARRTLLARRSLWTSIEQVIVAGR